MPKHQPQNTPVRNKTNEILDLARLNIANQIIDDVFGGENIKPREAIATSLVSAFDKYDVVSIVADPDKKQQVVDKIKESFQKKEYRDKRNYEFGDALLKPAAKKFKQIITKENQPSETEANWSYEVGDATNSIARKMGLAPKKEKHYTVPVDKIDSEVATISSFLENEAKIPEYKAPNTEKEIEKYNAVAGKDLSNAILQLNQKELDELAKKSLNQPAPSPVMQRQQAEVDSSAIEPTITSPTPPAEPSVVKEVSKKPPPPKGPSPRDKAATKIQKVFRGNQARDTVEQFIAIEGLSEDRKGKNNHIKAVNQLLALVEDVMSKKPQDTDKKLPPPPNRKPPVPPTRER